MTDDGTKRLKRLFKVIGLGLIDRVRAELDGGTAISVRSPDSGTTPLHHAVRMRQTEIAVLLIERGADPRLTDSHGQTALHLAEDRAVAERLIAQGADVHARDHFGFTALHTACRRADLDVAALLLDSGADVNAENADGRTPYRCASGVAMRDLLRARGATGLPGAEGRLLEPRRKRAGTADIDAQDGCIGADTAGNVWFAGRQGVFRFDGERVEQFRFAESFTVTGIAAAPGGIVYFATNWGLLTELHDDHLVHLATDPAGRVYLLGYEHERPEQHVGVFDGTGFALLRPGVDFPSGLDIKCLAFGPDGALILGCEKGYAHRQGNEWIVVTSDSTVYSVEHDGDALWLGTQFGVYRHGGVEPFKADLVVCLCRDGDSLWAGSSYGGLSRIRDGASTHYSADDSALPGDDIQGLARTTDGTVWILTEEGVAYVRDGDIRPLSAPAPPPPVRPRSLRPVPKDRLVPREHVPDDIVAAVRAAPLQNSTAELLLDLLRPAIEFDLAPTTAPPAVGASKFGGLPDLPDDATWPRYRHDSDRNLPLLLQVNLAEVHPFDLEGLLPADGMLSLFSDTSPDEIEDARVLHLEAGGARLRRRELAPDLVDRRAEADFIAELPEYAMVFSPRWTLPSREFLADRINLTEPDERAIEALREVLAVASSGSRLLGWPDNVQGEFLRDEKGIALLQLDGSALAPEGIWGGGGLIHFVGRRKSLRKRRFGKVTAFMTYT